MHIPYLWSETRKNAASSMQLFVGQSFQVNSQFSFFRKANHQWLCLWAMLDDTRSPIGYGLLPPLGQSLSETESFVDTSTSVSHYPFKLHWFSRYLRIRIIYCKFLAQNNCKCAIFTIFNKNPVGQSELAIQKFLVWSWPADGARLGKLRTVQTCCQPKIRRRSASLLFKARK